MERELDSERAGNAYRMVVTKTLLIGTLLGQKHLIISLIMMQLST